MFPGWHTNIKFELSLGAAFVSGLLAPELTSPVCEFSAPRPLSTPSGSQFSRYDVTIERGRAFDGGFVGPIGARVYIVHRGIPPEKVG
jgi:hypothetical protein